MYICMCGWMDGWMDGCIYIERERELYQRAVSTSCHTYGPLNFAVCIQIQRGSMKALRRLYEGCATKAQHAAIYDPLNFNTQRTQVLCNQAHLLLVKRGGAGIAAAEV